MPNGVSDKVVGRLSLYRRILARKHAEGVHNVFSHQLATASRCTAAQVRRDVMVTGCSGSPKHGYDVHELLEAIEDYLGTQEVVTVLVGIGNLGRALMAYFSLRRPRLCIEAAFDVDPRKVGRVIHGVRCHPMGELDDICREQGADVGIIAVPAGNAQSAADALIRAGVRGLLNFAPVPLHVPEGIYVENMDMTMSLEKVAFFARQ
jgi:redox-sensing transcriptional repressor